MKRMSMGEQVEQTGILPGTILGEKYRVEYIVGQGGMGAVYAVTHVDLGRKAAIKTLLPSFLKDEKVVARFRQEAQMAASIGHDNICEVIDVATTSEGMVYLLMPLLEGSNFSEFIERKVLSLEAIVDIISQTLSALEAAHRAKIVHRDLKPDNIFVTKIGDRENFVKLLDFGISKILDQESVTKLTQTGTMIGTPYYMPPEQAKGDTDIDYRADVYAIGVILYEALTGECPFGGTTYNQIMYKILSGQFVPPCKINPSIPEPVEEVIIKAMAYDRADRYDSADAMREHLHEALALAATHGYQPSAALDKEALAAMATIESEQGITQTPLADLSHATPMETVSSAPSKRKSLTVGILVVAILLLATVLYLFLIQGTQEDKNMLVPVAVPPMVHDAVPSVVPAQTVPIVPAAELDILEESQHPELNDKEKTEEKTVTKKKKRFKNRKERRTPSAEAKSSPEKTDSVQKSPASTKDKAVQGRFGTKFTSDY